VSDLLELFNFDEKEKGARMGERGKKH